MRILLDMVHHNPGEPPFESAYTDPAHLASLGYDGQVFKHLNACVPLGSFPSGSGEREWLHAAQQQRDREIAAAKSAGLAVYYHIDLVVLPKSLVAARRDELCDDRGRICLAREATLEVHRELLSALFERFPAVDGLMVRVGETYLFDTPHHVGNTAVPLHDESVPRAEQIRRFVRLLEFLREEVCLRQGKTLIHRTWDYFGDRFHADPDFYLAVTEAVTPHPRLIFSIKHTAGDFFRGCRPNPCLGLGRHPQIVEVQCQREYEGKGAYPNYVVRGVIEGFHEVPQPRGLRDWERSPLYAGLWTWSRGGGWYGPYLRHEFWPDLNTRVLASWAQEPAADEAALFARVAREALGLDDDSLAALREIALISEEAVWLGRSIPQLAALRDFREADCGRLWMRDDRLGGLDQLDGIFRELEAAGCLDATLSEKQRAARLFAALPELAGRVRCSDPSDTAALRASCAYGARLFALIAHGWGLLIARWRQRTSCPGRGVSAADLLRYEELLEAYQRLPQEHPSAASLYEMSYWHWPGEPDVPGFGASISAAAAPEA